MGPSPWSPCPSSLSLSHVTLKPDGTLRVTVSNCSSGVAKSTLEARLDLRRLPLLLRTVSEQQEALAGPP
ncbi:hypothetical protein BDQ94DRAFT_164628 [Aspergillus welwitschiae]|uniref:Uncharacterized protein n=1 Tax=Aspergillus welwitschiae TaxID=1341132 RepID=A0A3F3PHD7_9EURO|nr:hypothetical protein BDQ94DRAFT_164628 [Aspergillus welwitschiae]RDH26267.1 hypothetical protein BDQ94DRAFT_164628 [Aspergillus welwitschiae]